MLQTIDQLPTDDFRHVLVVRGWDDHQAMNDRAIGRNVRIVRQPRRGRDRLWSRRLASILRRESVDVLHVRGLSMLLDSVLAAGLCGDVAVAFSFHGFERPDFRLGGLRRRLYSAAVARCDDRWAVSSAAAEAIAARLHLVPEKFGVLTNSVDSRRYLPAGCRSEVRRRLGLPHDRTVILSVGNLKPVKGHDVLLEALRRCPAEAAGITLVLVGGDYLDGTLQEWANRHLPLHDVRFVGEQADPLAWYQAADMFVLPSRWEGMSNALLEAMACGLPVIATAVGGSLDVVDHGHTGLLVTPDSPVELAEAIRRLMTDEAESAALAAAGRALVQNHFAAPVAAKRYAQRYTRLARRARARRRSISRN
jgi:glycosyltransferase involved in cell wall biosynthesis